MSYPNVEECNVQNIQKVKAGTQRVSLRMTVAKAALQHLMAIS